MTHFSTSTPHSRLADIILELESALREQALWESSPPSFEALGSQQPFCVDTLRFSQWLQFIFIARIKIIIESGDTLPARSGIVPIAEENFRGADYDASRIIHCLAKFDALIEGK